MDMEATSENNTETSSSDYKYLHYELVQRESDYIEENRNTSETNGKKELLYELISPDGIHFWYCNSNTFLEKPILLGSHQQFVQLCFSIKGICSYRNEDTGQHLIFDKHEYNILHFQPQRFFIDIEKKEDNEIFVINFVPELFERYLPDFHPFLAQIRHTKENGELITLLNPYNLPITPKIKAILYEILNCPLENYYKRLYLRAKVVELLMILLSHADEYKPVEISSNIGLRKDEIEKMQQAREILHLNLQNPCSLIDLAHRVGTNENYLKKHFKQVFGNTVYGYVQEMRMQQAKNMLMQDDYDINEVARLSGYKQTHYFIAVFKKYFGYAPTQIKKQ